MKFDKEKLKETWGKVKTAIGNVSRKVWIIAAVVIVAVAAAVTIYLNTRPYSILVTGASAEEMSTVASWLEARNIRTYRYQGTDTILVPEGQATALKVALMSEVYQDGGSDFSAYFDNVGMLSTERERSNAWNLAVMQYFETVIEAMDGVQKAHVVITEGEDRSYVLDSGNIVEASASVQIVMRSGRTLTKQLANAARAFVSGGVQGLEFQSVVIIDGNGNVFSEGLSGGDYTDATMLKLEMEQEISMQVQARILNLLEPFVGEGHVRVGVNVTVDVNDTVEDIHEVWAPDYVDERTDGRGLIGSEVWGYRYIADDEVIGGGTVGTSSNSDILTDVERLPTLDDTDGKLEGEGQVDYENPYKDVHTVYTAGRVSNCTVSVSIDSERAANLDLNAMVGHVANAAGITAVETETMTAAEYLRSKISIYSGPFYQVAPDNIPGGWQWPFEDIVSGWIVLAALAGLLLFIILLVIILVSRSKKKKKLAAEEAERLQQQQSMDELLAAVGMPQLEPVGADVMSLQTEKSMELRQDIRQFVEENPEVAAQLLKNWLRGGEESA